MKSFCIMLLLATALPAAAADAATTELAIVQRDILVAAGPASGVPMPQSGEVLPCTYATGKGFHIVCRDAAGNPCVAFMPARDEWGHVTAAAWTHDDTLADHTVRVKIPLPLKRGCILLPRGRKYPVSARDDDSYTLAFSFGGYSQDVVVAKKDAVIEVPPPKTREQLRLERLEARWTRVEDERDRLQEKLSGLDDANARMHELLLELRKADIETATLRIQIEAAGRKQAMLMAHKPTESVAVQGEAKKLLTAVRQKENAVIKLSKTELLAGDLTTLQMRLERVEKDLQDTKVHAVRAGAELGVLENDLDDKRAREEQAALKAEIVKQERRVAARGKKLDLETVKRDRLTELGDRLADLEARNTALAEALRAVAQELAQLRAGEAMPEDK